MGWRGSAVRFTEVVAELRMLAATCCERLQRQVRRTGSGWLLDYPKSGNAESALEDTLCASLANRWQTMRWLRWGTPFVLVGATGFEPVTSSVSAKHREPLC